MSPDQKVNYSYYFSTNYYKFYLYNNCIRYEINDDEILLVFDRKVALLYRNDVDKYVSGRLWATSSYDTYVMNMLGYYNETTDSFYCWKMIYVIFF